MPETLSVTLQRGPRGFGFTLAGQGPCFLTNVTQGGVASVWGLRSGDRVVGVSGKRVEDAPHADIAAHLAEAGSCLLLTVTRDGGPSMAATNPLLTHSDDHTDQSSMDSDSQVWRQQRAVSEHRLASGSLRRMKSSSSSLGLPPPLPPAYHRSQFEHLVRPYTSALHSDSALSRSDRLRRKANSSASSLSRRRHRHHDPHFALTELNNNSLHNSLRTSSHRRSKGGMMGSRREGSSSSVRREGPDGLNRSRSEPDFVDRENVSSMADVATDHSSDDEGSISSQRTVSSSSSSASLQQDRDYHDPNLLFQCVVVYIGAVPVPNVGLSKRHIIRSALQSLRAQKARAHTVLLQIFADLVVVTNSRGETTQRFPGPSVVFAAACAENKQYFGICLAHSSTPRGAESSEVGVCHMFAADSELHLHSFHHKYAIKEARGNVDGAGSLDLGL